MHINPLKKPNIMQRRILILVSFLAALVLLVGCEKDVLEPVVKKDPPVVEPIAKFTVEITSNGDGGTVTPFVGTKDFDKGSTLKVTLNNKPGYKKSLKVNEAIVSLTGDDYVISDIANDYKLTANFEKTLSLYLTQNKWKKDSIYLREDNGTWSGYKLWGKPGELQEIVAFLPNGRMEIYNPLKGKVGDGPWSVDESKKPAILNYSGELLEVEYIDDSIMRLAKYDMPNVDPKITTKGAGRVVYSKYEE